MFQTISTFSNLPTGQSTFWKFWWNDKINVSLHQITTKNNLLLQINPTYELVENKTKSLIDAIASYNGYRQKMA